MIVTVSPLKEEAESIQLNYSYLRQINFTIKYILDYYNRLDLFTLTDARSKKMRDYLASTWNILDLTYS